MTTLLDKVKQNMFSVNEKLRTQISLIREKEKRASGNCEKLKFQGKKKKPLLGGFNSLMEITEEKLSELEGRVIIQNKQ